MSLTAVLIDYTNHRGQRGSRRIEPMEWYFGATEYHREKQWLLRAWDIDKKAERIFAVKDVHGWESAK